MTARNDAESQTLSRHDMAPRTSFLPKVSSPVLYLERSLMILTHLEEPYSHDRYGDRYRSYEWLPIT